jgi:carbon-monoxide dehydrogenase medium subunit
VRAFDYVAATSIDHAVTLLSQDVQTRVLAGGTDLIVQLREYRLAADVVIDIKHIPEVNELTYDPDGGLTIGAAVSCLRIRDASAAQLYPGLLDAVSLIGGIQIQARATLGGNLVNASPAADSIPALIVHNATCEIAGPKGTRRVPVESFCTAPGKTVLQPGEFLLRLHISPPADGFGAAYLRFIPRNEMDIAVVGVGASVMLDNTGTVFRSARIALGAVAPVPILAAEAGEYLTGAPVSDEAIDHAAQLAAEVTRPITDVRGSAAQRKHLSRVLTVRALKRAIERARANLGEDNGQ